MTDSGPASTHSPEELAIDPDVLARELTAELTGDPLDELSDQTEFGLDMTAECDQGLLWLKGGHDEQLQGLRVFCEHRDPRAVPSLLKLLDTPCPIKRMSAVYALGRNPSPLAVDTLLQLLQHDSNGYVRKSVAWSLGNYPDAPVLNPLIRALQLDIAAVRLWASSSLADAGGASAAKADPAAAQLLVSLRIDTESVVRSNSIWGLGRLYPLLMDLRREEVLTTILNAMVHDGDAGVRDEARVALEQLEDPEVLERVHTLVEEGLIL